MELLFLQKAQALQWYTQFFITHSDNSYTLIATMLSYIGGGGVSGGVGVGLGLAILFGVLGGAIDHNACYYSTDSRIAAASSIQQLTVQRQLLPVKLSIILKYKNINHNYAEIADVPNKKIHS